MKRIFVGIKIAPEKALTEFIDTLKNEFKHESVKWVEPENLHLTFLFIGETEEKTIEAIKLKLKKINHFKPIPFKLSGLGLFKNINNLRVIWIGISPINELRNLKEEIDKVIIPLYPGLKVENEYTPHLTIARPKYIKDKRLLHEIMNKFRNIELQNVVIDRFILFESKLTPKGPVYEVLEEYILK